jgi:hypothetical protein
VFFPGEALLLKKKKTVSPTINTEMKMPSDLTTFLSKKIMLQEVEAMRRIGQNMKKSTRQEKLRKRAPGAFFKCATEIKC